MINRICIVPVEFKNDYMIDSLKLYLNRTFDIPVLVRERKVNTAQAFDLNRNQYSSTTILKQLIQQPPERGMCRVIGICSFDLFIPIFTYVFGEAQVDGLGAVVSTHRLENQFYGGSPDEELLLERLMKEATHELGHTFGLTHCYNPGCVMGFSTYVEDIDDKNAAFCRECKGHIQEKI